MFEAMNIVLLTFLAVLNVMLIYNIYRSVTRYRTDMFILK